VNLYPVALYAHSYLRWVVLVLAVVVIGRAWMGERRDRPWSSPDERLHAALVGLVDLQFLLGLLLEVFLSPITRALFANPAAGMKDPVLRFFGVEHMVGMVLAVAAVHVGRVASKHAPTPRGRHRRLWVSTTVALVLMILATPWPALRYGRPLFRGGQASVPPAATQEKQATASPPPSIPQLSQQEAEPSRKVEPGAGSPASQCPRTYATRCAICHGGRGAGDGLAARSFRPPPRSFADPAWGKERSDDFIRAVIRDGGAKHGLNAAMPPQSDLPATEIDALVRCVRSLAQPS
jgi:mono/diheme cytochrome c family protein